MRISASIHISLFDRQDHRYTASPDARGLNTLRRSRNLLPRAVMLRDRPRSRSRNQTILFPLARHSAHLSIRATPSVQSPTREMRCLNFAARAESHFHRGFPVQRETIGARRCTGSVSGVGYRERGRGGMVTGREDGRKEMGKGGKVAGSAICV